MKIPSISILSGLLCLLSGISIAQKSFFSLLCSSPPEQIRISCDWDSLVTLKDNSSWDGLIQLVYADSVAEWNTELTVRGRFRRARCVFPPLELNLKKGALRSKNMFEFDKLKLVTHCKEDAEPTDLHEELLIYQLYGLLTEYSFKALLLNIDYMYPNGKPFLKNAPALLLEPTAELSHRLHAEELEVFGAPADSLDATSYCRNALFQFMIGNFDWDLSMQRNVKMVGQSGKYHVVPYDFDFSAIVFPSYARLPSDHGLKDFRDRVYLGQFFPEQLPVSIRELLSKKEAILNHVSDYPHLTKMRRKEIMEYLDQFFDFIEKPDLQLARGTILSYQPE